MKLHFFADIFSSCNLLYCCNIIDIGGVVVIDNIVLHMYFALGCRIIRHAAQSAAIHQPQPGPQHVYPHIQQPGTAAGHKGLVQFVAQREKQHNAH